MERLIPALMCLLILGSCSSRPGVQTRKTAAEDAGNSSVRTSISLAGKTPKDLKNYHVILNTTMGKIEIAFLPELAPEHVRNFLRLTQLGFYDHTAWHRIIRGCFIQGGDLGTRNPPLQMVEITGGVRRLSPEFSRLKHQEGIVSMARGDALDSAETSFFICTASQPTLDNKYTIFGKVVSGMDTVKKIANVPLGEKGKPRERVELERAEIIEAKP